MPGDAKIDAIHVQTAIADCGAFEPLYHFVRREFSIITPSGERSSFNRIEFSGWEDVDQSAVDPPVFSTEIPMTSPSGD